MPFTSPKGKKITYESGIASISPPAPLRSVARKRSEMRGSACRCLMRRFLFLAIARGEFSLDSSRCLNHHSNLLTIIAIPSGEHGRRKRAKADSEQRRRTGDALWLALK